MRSGLFVEVRIGTSLIEHVDQFAMLSKESESIGAHQNMKRAVCCFDNGENLFFDDAPA